MTACKVKTDPHVYCKAADGCHYCKHCKVKL